MSLPISLEVTDNPDLLVGIVEARGVPAGPASASLEAEIDAALAKRLGVEPQPSAITAAIRDLLRKGGYKPTGRGKPASEYLAQAAARSEFPRISHVVDALNFVSLESGLPISLLDTDLAMAGATGLVIRLGAAGESYEFNAAGHVIDIEGLLTVARKDGAALGNAVKDGVATKTTPETKNVLAVVWASRRVVDAAALAQVCVRLARLLGEAETSVRVLDATKR
jgi:DNA/RNA-binding domain of Phe-tRNA-synthetase-like protein